jgi:PTS system nitrogen regulatory IIA component
MRWRNAGSTGVGHGVAAPHARLAGLSRLRGVFVRLEQPVDFDSVDDQPVDLIFALFAPKEAAGVEHLRALARVSRVMRQADLREQLRQARTADAVLALLVQDQASTRSSAA